MKRKIKQEEDDEVDEAPKVAGVENDENKHVVAKEMRDPGCGASR